MVLTKAIRRADVFYEFSYYNSGTYEPMQCHIIEGLLYNFYFAAGSIESFLAGFK